MLCPVQAFHQERASEDYYSDHWYIHQLYIPIE